jgi:hypothetical protein
MGLYDFSKVGKYWVLNITHTGEPLNYNDVREFNAKRLNWCNDAIPMPTKAGGMNLGDLKDWTESTKKFVLPCGEVTKPQVNWLQDCLNGTLKK